MRPQFWRLTMWALLGIGFVAFHEFLKLYEIDQYLFSKVTKSNNSASFINVAAAFHGFLEALVFINWYYPGTLVLIYLYALTVMLAFNLVNFTVSVIAGVGLGIFASYFIGSRFQNVSKYKLVNSFLRLSERYDYLWIVISAWNPNWLSLTFCVLGLKRKPLLSIWLTAIFSSAIYYAFYVLLFKSVVANLNIVNSNIYYLLGFLIFLFGFILELGEAKFVDKPK
jgi:hypothetical protein